MITNKALNVNGSLANTALFFKVYRDRVADFADLIVNFALCFDWQVVEKSPKYEVYKLVVDGFGGTDKAKRFFSDIIARFEMINTDIFADIEQKFTSEPCQVGLKKLSELLPSLPSSCVRYVERVLNNPQGYIDPYFVAIKAQMELFISQGLTSNYFILFDWAIKEFPNKDFSTLKSKARSVYNWYAERSFSLKNSVYKRKLTDKEYQMTRSENMKRVKTNQKIDTRNKIKGVLDDDVLFNEYKHTEGRWAGYINVEKLAKRLNMRNETIRSHLKEMGLR